MRFWQVRDAMLLEAEATVMIDVVSINTPPQAACGEDRAGLFSHGSLLASLQLLTSHGSAGADRAATVAELVAARDAAVDEDPVMRRLRTQALERLASAAQQGQLIDGNNSFAVACTARGVWEVQMAGPEETHLGVSLLAFDSEDTTVTYHVAEPPKHGVLYAINSLPGASVSQVGKASFRRRFEAMARDVKGAGGGQERRVKSRRCGGGF